jgi:hypothetical protein
MQKFLKVYSSVIILVVLAAFLFGFVIPVLISAKSTELVVLGFLAVLVSVPFYILSIYKIYKGI